MEWVRNAVIIVWSIVISTCADFGVDWIDGDGFDSEYKVRKEAKSNLEGVCTE